MNVIHLLYIYIMFYIYYVYIYYMLYIYIYILQQFSLKYVAFESTLLNFTQNLSFLLCCPYEALEGPIS